MAAAGERKTAPGSCHIDSAAERGSGHRAAEFFHGHPRPKQSATQGHIHPQPGEAERDRDHDEPVGHRGRLTPRITQVIGNKGSGNGIATRGAAGFAAVLAHPQQQPARAWRQAGPGRGDQSRMDLTARSRESRADRARRISSSEVRTVGRAVGASRSAGSTARVVVRRGSFFERPGQRER